MAAPKKGFRRHIHIDPYVYPAIDPRVDKALAWYDAMPNGKRTKLCWDLIVAAVNGELGIASSTTLIDEDADRSQKALDDLLRNMVLDED